MARRVDTFLLEFVADGRKFTRNVREMVGETKKAEKEFTSVRAAAKDALSGFNLFDVAQVGVGSAFIKKSVDAYGQLVNVQETAKQVFDDSYDSIQQWSEAAVESVGLSERAATQAATFIAGLGKAAGISSDDLAAFSTDIVQLGADLAAAFNTDTADAIEAIQSGFSGTSVEPLRRYNIVINDTAIKQRYAALTGREVVGTLNQQERTIGFLSLLYENSADYIGQWARESDGLLGTQQRLRAQLENTAATLGETYAPAVLTALDSTLALANAFVEFDAKIGGLGGAAAGFAAITLALTPMRQAVRKFSENLAASTTSASKFAGAVGAINPIMVGVTAAVVGYSLAASKVAAESRDVTEAVEELGAAAGDVSVELEKARKVLDEMAESEAADEFFSLGTAAEYLLKPLGLVGVVWDYVRDRQNLTLEEAKESFRELASESLDAAIVLREAVAAGDEIGKEFADAGISLKFMDNVINEIVEAQGSVNDLLEAGNVRLGRLIEGAEDYGEAMFAGFGPRVQKMLEEWVDLIPKMAQEVKTAKGEIAAFFEDAAEAAERSAETMAEFVEYFNQLDEVRLEAQVEALDSIFADRSAGFRTLNNLRGINVALGELDKIEGNLGNIIGDIFDPNNENVDEFLQQIGNIGAAVQDQMVAALESGGVEEYRRVGVDLRRQINAGLIAAGADEATIQSVLESMGLTDEAITQNVEIIVNASKTAEATLLLELLADNDLLGKGAGKVERFIELSAIIKEDPQQGLNALQYLASEQGITFPAEAVPTFDPVAAQRLLDDADVSTDFILEAKIDEAAIRAQLVALGLDPDTEPITVPAVIDDEMIRTWIEGVTGLPVLNIHGEVDEEDLRTKLNAGDPIPVMLGPELPSDARVLISEQLDALGGLFSIDTTVNPVPPDDLDPIEEIFGDWDTDLDVDIEVTETGATTAKTQIDTASKDRFSTIWVTYRTTNSPPSVVSSQQGAGGYPTTLRTPTSGLAAGGGTVNNYFGGGTPSSTFNDYQTYVYRNGVRVYR